MKRLIAYLLPALLLLAGCSIDEGGSFAPVNGTPGGMTFVVNLPDPNTGPVSYALSEDDENTVNTVDVFAFQKNGDSYELVEHTEVEAGTIIADNQNKRKISFRANFRKLKENEFYQYVILGNAKDMVSTTPGMERDVLMSLFKTEGIARWVDASRDIPMWGESADMKLTTDMKIENLKLLRMLAKINVEVDLDPEEFELTSVRLYNYRTGGYVVPDRENMEDSSTEIVKAPTLLGDRVEYPEEPVYYSGDDLEDNNCINQIYTFETEVPWISDDVPDFEKVHALVIGGSYNGNPESYYRVNFSKTVRDEDAGRDTTIYLDLLRNHRYTINITEVSGNGYLSPEEAFESRGHHMKSEVIDWNDGEMTDVVFDGQNYISVSPVEFSLYKDAKTSNKFTILTDVQGDWTITGTSASGTLHIGFDVDWITNITPLSNNTLGVKSTVTFDVSENTTGVERTAYIHVKAGRLSFAVKVTQGSTLGKGVWILDENGENEITELLFSSVAGELQIPSAQSFLLRWAPASSTVHINKTSVAFGVAEFSYNALPDNDTPGEGMFSISQVSGETMLTIQPEALTQTEVEENPFIEKASKVDFTVSSGSGHATRSIFLRQVNFNTVVDYADSYILNGTTCLFIVKSNTAWVISTVDDENEILDETSIQTLNGKSGGYNTAGEEVSFNLINDLSGVKDGKTATLTFTDPTGRMNPFYVVIKGVVPAE